MAILPYRRWNLDKLSETKRPWERGFALDKPGESVWGPDSFMDTGTPGKLLNLNIRTGELRSHPLVSPGQAWEIAVDGENRLYVSGPENGDITVLDGSLQPQGIIPTGRPNLLKVTGTEDGCVVAWAPGQDEVFLERFRATGEKLWRCIVPVRSAVPLLLNNLHVTYKDGRSCLAFAEDAVTVCRVDQQGRLVDRQELFPVERERTRYSLPAPFTQAQVHTPYLVGCVADLASPSLWLLYNHTTKWGKSIPVLIHQEDTGALVAFAFPDDIRIHRIAVAVGGNLVGYGPSLPSGDCYVFLFRTPERAEGTALSDLLSSLNDEDVSVPPDWTPGKRRKILTWVLHRKNQ